MRPWWKSESKAAVLSEVEGLVDTETILTSNTSTIPINLLAKSLKRPQNFCGMHFFNPVHRMPLVEIIRGEHTSEDTINRVVAYAAKWANHRLWSMIAQDSSLTAYSSLTLQALAY